MSTASITQVYEEIRAQKPHLVKDMQPDDFMVTTSINNAWEPRGKFLHRVCIN